MSSNQPADQKNSDWWIFYLVRYFVGTTTGAVIVFALNSNVNSSLYGALAPGVTSIAGIDTPVAVVLAVLGLAFCYISSAPILVLHATRNFFFTPIERFAKRMLTAVCVILALLAAYLLIGAPPGTAPPQLPWIAFVMILALQLVPLGLTLWGEGHETHKYYIALTKARRSKRLGATEYVESYRHLREHGNAFFIVFFEAVLGLLLWAAGEYGVIILFFWILPAIFVWAVGTQLEYRYSKSY